MKLMLSIWLAFLALIPITKDLPNAEDIQNQFLDAVDDEYQQYQILNDLSYYSTDLELIVVRGIYNNLPCYGISFYSDKFDVVISTVDGLYSLPQTSKRSSSIIALKAEMTYEIVVLTDKGEEYKLPKTILLSKFINDDLNLNEMTIGKNNFKPFQKVDIYTYRLPFYKSLIIVLISISSLCLVMIIIMFIMKKGFFNKEKRKQGILDIRSILEAETEDKANDVFDDIKDSIMANNDNVIDAKASIIEENYEDEETHLEEIEDLKGYLQSLGFITDYNVLSEEEKNLVMLELMKLKDTKRISLKKYYEETYQLWKK